MNLETAQITTNCKSSHSHKQGEYDMWRLRIEQYFQVQDYALWDVIENGNSFKHAAKTTTNADGTSTTLIPCRVTTKENVQKKNDMKARRLGGIPKIEVPPAGLSLGENLSQEDLNLKILRSLSSKWNTHVVSWRINLSRHNELLIISITIFKICLNKIKRTSKAQAGPRNQDCKNSNQDSSRRTVNVEETYSKAMVALMAFSDSENEVIFCEQLAVLKRDISYKDSEISMLKRSQIPNKNRKGLGFVSYNVVPPPPTGLFSPPNLDFFYSSLEEFQQPEFEGYGPKPRKSVSEDTSNEVKESSDAPIG
ncbi:hypothetical protein Tco_0833945 [Tanacetum coccineum]